MKQLYLFLLFIVGTVASSLEYHGNRTYWTTVDSAGKTYIALHILAEPVNIIFPKDKTFADIASDIKLYSPTGNEKCQDLTNTLDLTLLFDDENHIRGAIKVVVDNGEAKVKMFMYEKCGRDEKHNDYATVTIEDIRQDFEADGRDCFKTRDPFHPYEKDDTKNFMELQVPLNNFGCQVFMILPKYMHVEDFPLPKFDTVKPLNASFAGHDEKFWWKSKNDSMLPSAVSFDSSKNVRINILKSTKNESYFFRIGNEQPIPTFNFTLGENCNGAKIEAFMNLKPECLILFEKKNDGFTISTKTSPYNHFKGSLSSMIFGDEHVFVKVKSPLTVKSLKVCNFSNLPDVPPDQFVLQVAALKGNDGCEKAEIVLLSSGSNGTEVLIDRSKIIKDTNATTNDNSTVVVTTSESTESAGLEWYWYLIISILAVGILAAIIVFIFCIRRRRQKAKKSKVPVESVEDEEVGRRTITTKTAVSPEKVSKEQKPKVSDGKKDEKKKEKHAKKEAKGNDKPLKDQKVQPAKIQSVQPPKHLALPPIQPSQEKHVEPPAAPKPPLPLPVVAPPKPLRNLKFRSMYGEDKRTKLEEPFDYHENEESEFQPTKVPAEFPRPDLRVHDNFWDCLGAIFKTTMYCRVFADNFFNGNTNVYFMFTRGHGVGIKKNFFT